VQTLYSDIKAEEEAESECGEKDLEKKRLPSFPPIILTAF